MFKKLICVAATYAIMTASIALAHQEEHSDGKHRHHQYRLIDVGTFGGPVNYIKGYFFLSEYIGDAQDGNNAGTLTGWADTSTPDPYALLCFNGGCSVAYAFRWRTESRPTSAHCLAVGASASSGVSANGLIAGASQNGETDPLLPPPARAPQPERKEQQPTQRAKISHS